MFTAGVSNRPSGLALLLYASLRPAVGWLCLRCHGFSACSRSSFLPQLSVLILMPGFFSAPRFLSYQTARLPRVLISACQQYFPWESFLPKSPGIPPGTPHRGGWLLPSWSQRDCQGSNARLSRIQLKPCIRTALHHVLENKKRSTCC